MRWKEMSIGLVFTLLFTFALLQFVSANETITSDQIWNAAETASDTALVIGETANQEIAQRTGMAEFSVFLVIIMVILLLSGRGGAIAVVIMMLLILQMSSSGLLGGLL